MSDEADNEDYDRQSERVQLAERVGDSRKHPEGSKALGKGAAAKASLPCHWPEPFIGAPSQGLARRL